MENSQPYFFVRCNGRYEKINYTDLILIRGRRGYMQVVTETKTYLVLVSMQTVKQYLPPTLFCQVHRSYIIALDRIRAFDNKTIWLQEPPAGKEYNRGLARLKEIPLGYHFRKNLRDSVKIMPNRGGVHNGILEEAKLILEEEKFELES